MKTKKSIILWTIIVVTVMFTSCSESINAPEDPFNLDGLEKSGYFSQATADLCTFTGTLTDSEKEGLMLMREEEKLARDVYAFFYAKYNQTVFSNISGSEETHTNAILFLINGYGLIDPTPASAATFSDPSFTVLYAQLTEQGSVSIAEALKTGAFIEEYDIADLENLLNETQNEDVIRVYENLLSGSKNHLRAFVKILNNLGETYNPTLISEVQFLEILSETSGSGNGKKGNKQFGNGGSLSKGKSNKKGR